MMPLYRLADEIAAILDTDDDELPEDLEQRLDALALAFEQKLEQCCYAARNLDALAEAKRREAQRLAVEAGRNEARLERLKGYMLQCLVASGLRKTQAGLFKVWTQANPPSVQLAADLDPRQLPPEFRREKVEADKRAILDAAKGGAELPSGVSITQTQSLRIK